MDSPQAPLQLGCWSKLFIVLILGVAAIAVTLAFWLRSTADLDAERARAVALGVELDWEKLGVTGDRSVQRRTLDEVAKIAERAKPYDGSSYEWERDPWRASAPSDLAGWNSGVDVDLDAAIDRLDGIPALQIAPGEIAAARLSHNAKRFVRGFDDWQRLNTYDAVHVLKRRSLIATGDMSALADRLVRLAGSGPNLHSIWGSFSASEAFINHVLRHRDALDPRLTAAQARQLAASLESQLLVVVRCGPAFWEGALRLPCEEVLRAWNLRLPSLMQYRSLQDLFQRSGRRAVLARAIDAAAWVGVNGLPQTPAQVEAMSPGWPQMTPWRVLRDLYGATVDPGGCAHCAGRQVGQVHSLTVKWLRQRAYLLLLAADFDGSAWPSDPGDSAGGTLRPILRDGLVIGAYSFGADMRDDGGLTRVDWCFPLRAPLGYPRAADPPKIP
ncbi:MAG TPA: hypothetical protein DCS97_05670 [Planctomycetes bacterium]|nr:hypothetical protein [Planctomycetota bacterium]